MPSARDERRLIAIPAADVAAYSLLTMNIAAKDKMYAGPAICAGGGRYAAADC